MWTELRRKMFHLLAAIYVVGVVYVPRQRYVLLVAAWFLTVTILEYLRLRVPTINEWTAKHFGNLFRQEEEKRFSGIFWMTAGVLSTILLIQPVSLAATALLYLIFGDAAASLVGLRLRGPFWPGSKKRLSGSAACFLVCISVGITILRPSYGWNGIIFGAAAATLAELGIIPVNDNLTIPIAAALAFLFCYRSF